MEVPELPPVEWVEGEDEAFGGTLGTEWWPDGGEIFRVVPLPEAESRLGGHRGMP